MNRTEFEILRDLPGKIVRGDIRFSQRQATRPALVAEDIRIVNKQGMDLRLTIHHNPERGSTTFNVHIPGTGPICRLDVNGSRHGDAGRDHKHSIQTERCPDRNLPDDVDPKPELADEDLQTLWQEFFRMGAMEHQGRLVLPEGIP